MLNPIVALHGIKSSNVSKYIYIYIYIYIIKKIEMNVRIQE